MNILLVVVIFITLPFIMKLIHPKKPEQRIQVDPELLKETTVQVDETPSNQLSPNDKLDRSRGIVLLGGLFGLFYLGNHFITNGFTLDLNTVNFMFLTAALLLYGNVRELGNGLMKASSSIGQFALQYPFYAFGNYLNLQLKLLRRL
ncbi:TIGR00366 family protein [Alteribacillus bidgolensis]|uniref:Short-chain fatty acids transporter n=1 Tax=Alteribacillus bidgolensis TaxID=930129 RepID=A0A1G8QZU1_9BACI|nr:TIGR00366 family protein [Alteribacillus bidgolensis]SDJ09825.1 short-chain fatty acids transporter [Alteribacillus bidgolensis]